MARVDINYFFLDPSRFPWQWYRGIPKTGTLHSYLVDFCLPYVGDKEKALYAGRPTLRELRRMADMDEEGLTYELVKFCDYINNNSSRGLEMDILSFISQVPPFREAFQKKVDELFRLGGLSVPNRYIIQDKQAADRSDLGLSLW